MELTLTARHCDVTDRFRSYVEERILRFEQHDRPIERVVVDLDASPAHHAPKGAVCVRMSVHAGHDSLRADACAGDRKDAFDLAMDKLVVQLRKVADRRRVHRGRHAPESLSHAMSRAEVA